MTTKFRVGWEFNVPAVMTLQDRAPGVLEPIVSVEDKGKDNIKHLRVVELPVCEETVPIK